MSDTAFDATLTRAIARRMRDLALLAGAETMKYFRSATLDVRGKPDGTPVSAADLAANAMIMAGLRESFPAIPVVSEEVGSGVPEDWAAPFFLLDPLDGTKEFIRGSGDFTVNIALVVGHAPVLGAVFAPVSNRLQWVRGPGDAVEETPPFSADSLGDLHPLACRVADNAAITAALSRSHMNAATRDYISHYALAHAIHAGSSLKFCLLAAGQADLYPRLSPTMEWDTAAADAVLAAAGGRTVDFVTGEPLRYGKPGLANPFFIAHGPGVRLVPPPS
jgi:3'(2'), 5'-bisphosphate nucleotidase